MRFYCKQSKQHNIKNNKVMVYSFIGLQHTFVKFEKNCVFQHNYLPVGGNISNKMNGKLINNH